MIEEVVDLVGVRPETRGRYRDGRDTLGSVEGTGNGVGPRRRSEWRCTDGTNRHGTGGCGRVFHGSPSRGPTDTLTHGYGRDPPSWYDTRPSPDTPRSDVRDTHRDIRPPPTHGHHRPRETHTERVERVPDSRPSDRGPPQTPGVSRRGVRRVRHRPTVSLGHTPDPVGPVPRTSSFPSDPRSYTFPRFPRPLNGPQTQQYQQRFSSFSDPNPSGKDSSPSNSLPRH